MASSKKPKKKPHKRSRFRTYVREHHLGLIGILLSAFLRRLNAAMLFNNRAVESKPDSSKEVRNRVAFSRSLFQTADKQVGLILLGHRRLP
jgi:hypothetical protein